MGDFQHKFITVIGNYEGLKKAADKAEALHIPCTPTYPVSSNDFWILYTLPSGSKIGWSKHEAALIKLRQFIDWLEEEAICYEFFSYGDYGSFIGRDSLT